jgi:8-oxo-dGTP pyrophosphatase MutT (NUDIX family)
MPTSRTRVLRPADLEAPAPLPQGPAHAFAKQLTDVDRDRTSPYIRPKHAATLILLDTTGRVPKVLMGRRHHGLKFMAGKFVFPGGRVDPADRRMAAANALPEIVEDKLASRRARPSHSRGRSLALAAIRETFEETGILLGSRDYGAPVDPPPGPWTEFAAHGVYPDLGEVRFIARAITPPRRPRRFDTSFFSLDASAIAKRVDNVVTADSELVELVWVPLPQAKELDLPHITGVVLKELDTRIAGGMRHDLPVPFYYERARKWFREEL